MQPFSAKFSSPNVYSGSGRRIPQLDGLRAVAFFSVFFWHGFRIPDKLVLWAGVDLFFVLSGFLITGILLSSEQRPLSKYFGRFYARRARRILPPYAMAAILAAALFPVALREEWPWYVFFSSNIGQALGANIPAPMTTFWSLAVEEQFYLLWPLVVVACPAKTLRRVAVAGLFLVPVCRALCSHWLSVSGAIFLLTPFRLDLLLAGAFLAVLWREHGAIPHALQRLCLPIMGATVAIYGALCCFPGFERDSGSVLFDGIGYSLILVFCAALLTYVLALTPGGLFYRFLTFGPVAYLGRISYMLYLVHSTFIMASVKYFNRYGHFLSRFLALGGTILVASVSWHLIEKRLIRAQPRIRVVASQ